MIKHRFRKQALFACLLILTVLVTACGGSSGTTTSTASSIHAPLAAKSASGAPNTSAPSQANTTSSNTNSPSSSPQYLIKSLQVELSVQDTRAVATELQAWINNTDPRAASNGINYQENGDTPPLYTVTLKYSVQATLYPQIEEYLANYSKQHGGTLVTLHEDVQDVTNDYVDTASRLTNLKGEQQRLLVLLSSATALGDVLAIEQRLTDVEGQIEQMEAHINDLKGQTSFYNITITLDPIGPAAAPPTQPNGWSFGQIWSGAWSASIGFGQGLLTVIVWLLSFSIYLVPAAVIGWFVMYRRRRPRPRFAVPQEVTLPPTQS